MKQVEALVTTVFRDIIYQLWQVQVRALGGITLRKAASLLLRVSKVMAALGI